MASNMKNGRLKIFDKKVLKLSEVFVYSCSTDYLFWSGSLLIPENFKKNVSAPKTCGVRKYRPHNALSLQ